MLSFIHTRITTRYGMKQPTVHTSCDFMVPCLIVGSINTEDATPPYAKPNRNEALRAL